MTEHVDQKHHVKQVFERTARTYDTIVPFFAAFGQKMVAWSELERGQRVLDIAVGRGAVLKPALRAIGPTGRIVALDMSPAMINELAADLGAVDGTNVDLVVMDAEALGLAGGVFDAVLCGFAVHLLPHPGQAIAEVLRVLRPGGIFVFSIPGPGSGTRWSFYSVAIERFHSLVDAAKWSLAEPPDPVQLLREARFVSVEKVYEEVHLSIESPEVFWAMEMSHGMRGFIDALPDVAQREFKAEVFRGLDEMGKHRPIVLDRGAYFIKAFKPEKTEAAHPLPSA
ncbi:MAG: class I SAM-dependent methyltransferase [Thermomicrobiales bacterium]